MEPLEEYNSPFDFEQAVNASYLYLSTAYADTPPSSPTAASRGPESQLHADTEVGEDAVTAVSPSTSPPALTEEERQELQEELIKVEDEIQTLSQVLAAKEKQLADIKRKLGITPLNELKQNISRTWQDVTASTAYRRTSETLSQASLKATAAFSSMGSALSRRLEDVSVRSLQHSASMPAMRKAPSFKSLEERVGTLKTKMGPPPPAAAGPAQQSSGGPATEALLPEAEGLPPQESPRN